MAIANLRAHGSTRSAKSGRDVPFVNWRYILFNWNDSRRRDGRGARQMAAEIGVDRLCWEITDHPEDGFSRRFAPGTPDYERIRHEIWDNSGLGNAIPGATPRAEIDVPHGAAGPAVPGPRRDAADADGARARTCRRGRSARRPATAGAWCASARS